MPRKGVPNALIDKSPCIFYYAHTMIETPIPIVLASISPRRRELIALFGFKCEFISADVDESVYPNESPEEMVRRLARAKAEIGVQHAQRPNAIVIAADTTVWIDDKIIGKPLDADDAIRMLKFLRNRPHTVFSGLTVRRGNQ
jgi:septum formation protein